MNSKHAQEAGIKLHGSPWDEKGARNFLIERSEEGAVSLGECDEVAVGDLLGPLDPGGELHCVVIIHQKLKTDILGRF